MKKMLAVLGMVAMFALQVLGDAADDQFIDAYQLIQQADAMQSRGQAQDAWDRYHQAQAILQRIQIAFPNWNDKLVKFRLDYIARKTAALKAQSPQLARPSAPSAPAVAPKSDIKPPASAPAVNVQPFIDQISRLTQEKNLLEAKLKEALSAQPRAVDPRELKQAEKRAKALEKERDLAKVSFEQQTQSVAALTKEKQALEKKVETLSSKSEADALRVENKSLKKQVADLTKTAATLPKVEELSRQISQARTELQAEQSRGENLRKENQKMEKLLNDPRIEREAQAAAATQRELSRKLNEALAALDAQKKSHDVLQREKAQLEKRLAAATPPDETDAMRVENKALKKQVADLSKTAASLPQVEELVRQVGQARAELQAEQVRGENIRKENQKLEKLLTDPEVEKQAQAAAAAQRELSRKLNEAISDLGLQKRNYEALQKENAKLEKVLTEAAPPPSGISPMKLAALEKELAQARADLAKSEAVAGQLKEAKTALSAELARNKSLGTEAKHLQNQVADSTAKAEKSAKTIASLESQIKNLKSDLAAKPAAKRAKTTAEPSAEAVQLREATAQLAALRAQLDVYEAQKVPFTTEELALLKPKEAVVAVNSAPPPARASKELPPGSQALVGQAHKAFAEGRYDEAEAKYLEILNLDQNNIFTLTDLAAVQLQLNKLSAAETHLKRALNLDPKDAFSLAIFGLLKYRQGSLDEALTALSQAAALNPNHAETQNYLGLVLSQKGQRAAAETAFRKAIQISPGYGNAHHNLAVHYGTQHPPLIELARWHYQKALAAGHPKNADLEKSLGGN